MIVHLSRSAAAAAMLRVAAALLLIVGAMRQLAADDAPPRRDGDGDPLPPGARYRLGTKLWRSESPQGMSLAWSADGKRLALLSGYREITIFDAATGRRVLQFAPVDAAGTVLPQSICLTFSPNGEEIAVRAYSSQIVTFDAASGKHRRTYALGTPEYGNRGNVLTYSANGKYLGLSMQPFGLVIDRASGETIIQEDQNQQVQSLALTHDSRRAVVLGLNPSLRVWDLAKKAIVHRSDVVRQQGSITGMIASRDASRVALLGPTITLVDPAADKVLVELKDGSGQQSLGAAFTPDEKHLIAAYSQGVIQVWDVATGRLQKKLTAPAGHGNWQAFGLSPDGKFAALAGNINQVLLADLERGVFLAEDQPAHTGRVAAIRFSPDGEKLASGCTSGRTHLWDAGSGEHQRQIDALSASLEFTPDGQQLVTLHRQSPLVQTWNLATGERLRDWSNDLSQAYSIGMAADQAHLSLLQYHQQDRQYRAVRLTFPALEPAGEAIIGASLRGTMAAGPDGRVVAVPDSGGVRLIDLAAPDLETELARSVLVVQSSISPDGRFLVAICADKDVRIYELATGGLTRTIELEQTVTAMTIDRRGRLLVTALGSLLGEKVRQDSSIAFWDLPSGKKLAELAGYEVGVVSLDLSADGKRLATGLADTTAIVWDVPPAAIAHEFVSAKLTAEEAAECWRELASPAAETAQAALLRLAQDPERALAISTERLVPAEPLEAESLEALFTQLDDESFAERLAAFDVLASYGSAIEAQLRREIEKPRSGEVRLRCGELLKLQFRRYPHRESTLADTRGVQLLEWIGKERARAQLTKLAAGAAEGHLTREALAALARLPQPRQE
jgi:WD40 repeat protein